MASTPTRFQRPLGCIGKLHASRRHERDQIDREIVNLAAAIAGGGDAPSLVAEVRKREAPPSL